MWGPVQRHPGLNSHLSNTFSEKSFFIGQSRVLGRGQLTVTWPDHVCETQADPGQAVTSRVSQGLPYCSPHLSARPCSHSTQHRLPLGLARPAGLEAGWVH